MSFRELRNFTEMMKSLGYRRLISVDNFRTPNFPLVADILFWLIRRYDPSADLSDDISDETARVDFLKGCAEFLMNRLRIKVSIKKLYRADGYAVQELLKVCSMLYSALMTEPSDMEDLSTSDVSSTLAELKQAREWASEIVDSGSKLYSLLGHEEELKRSRDRALQFLDSLSLNLDSNDPQKMIERSVRSKLNSVTENVQQLQERCKNLEQDQTSLSQKIKKKQTELERAEKRLKSLRKVKPAFMKEYENMEAELKMVYEQYVERYRNLSYLEHQLDQYHREEREKKQRSNRALKRMQKRLREEELRILRGDTQDNNDLVDDRQFDSDRETSDASRPRRPDRPRAADARRRDSRRQPDVQGSMIADDSQSSSSGSSMANSGDDSNLSDDQDDLDDSGDSFDSQDEDPNDDDQDEDDDDYF